MKRARRLTSLVFLSLLKFATSLITLDPALPDPNTLPISSLPTHSNNNNVIVVSWDGSMSLAELDSKRIHWTYKSGVPIYSSYQAPENVGTYIDVGVDWQLYIHDKTKGIIKRLRTSVRDLVSSTPISVNGTTIIGQMTTTVSILNAKTGALVKTFSPMQMGFDGENPVVLGQPFKKLLEPGDSIQEAAELVYITRTDYAFMAYSESRAVLWNFMYSDVVAEFSSGSDISCSKSFFSTRKSVGLEDKAESGLPVSCQKNVMVYRIRDRGHSDHLSLVGSVDNLPYSSVGDTELVLYSGENADLQLSIPEQGRPIGHHGGVKDELLALGPFESIAMTAIALPAAGLDTGDTFSRQPLWLSLVLFCLFVIVIVGFAIHYFVLMPSKKQDKDLKSKPSVPKKKKAKKSGPMKNNKIDKPEGSEFNMGNEGSFGKIAYQNKSLSGLISGYTEGRQIGKLYISSREIARGSNGTVVLEGVYDSRPVAVKRLVQTHHDVALKEIQNLIASDQHPNIIRWYGMEFDADFVYLSLERCAYNLNDFVSLYSQPQESATSHDTDFKLWRDNGYPSAQLLKLMRDVVSGLAHLHEIGIIHRDLKPQNVLIIKEKTFCAKLSDMGISKRLDGDMTSLTQHATGLGSSGWRAPEQLKNGRQSRAMDLFSLGCVLFFCITGGRHPFGDSYERDANVVNNHKDLFLVDSIPEAFDLINSLLNPNPDLRPKAVAVLHHPLFWNSDTRLSFLRDVSDRVELEDRETESDLLMALESVGFDALGGKWDEKLDNSFLENIGKYRRYKYDSVRDLLRVVRNKLNHYRELPRDIQESLGSVPLGFDHYFTSRFPRLLIEVYKVISQYCQGEELLSKYFNTSM
ncbi:hypothetical protein V2J09_007034 [Rumex salicifolius]